MSSENSLDFTLLFVRKNMFQHKTKQNIWMLFKQVLVNGTDFFCIEYPMIVKNDTITNSFPINENSVDFLTITNSCLHSSERYTVNVFISTKFLKYFPNISSFYVGFILRILPSYSQFGIL